MQSMVEGAPRPLYDPFRNRRCVTHDVFGWNADDAQASFAQAIVATLVPLDTIRLLVRGTVDLDDQGRFAAIEIRHVGFDRMLAAKFESTGPAAHMPPEEHLRQGHFATKAACQIDSRAAERRRAPSTGFHPVPLPVPGRILACFHQPSAPARLSLVSSSRSNLV